jgi:hypothetical protein
MLVHINHRHGVHTCETRENEQVEEDKMNETIGRQTFSYEHSIARVSRLVFFFLRHEGGGKCVRREEEKKLTRNIFNAFLAESRLSSTFCSVLSFSYYFSRVRGTVIGK